MTRRCPICDKEEDFPREIPPTKDTDDLCRECQDVIAETLQEFEDDD